MKLNELGRVTLRTQVPLLLDEYSPQRGHGLVHPDRPRHQRHRRRGHGPRHHARRPRTAQPERRASTESSSPREDRLSRGSTVWFTGLSGSGKSSVAMLVEQKLLENGRPAYVLDGDNLRHGLNADLGFSMADRAENLRRLAHVATLLADSGPDRAGARDQPARGAPRAGAPGAPTEAASTSSRCSATPRSRTASAATPRGCTPRRGAVRSRTSPASTARISGRRTRICASRPDRTPEELAQHGHRH